MSTFPNEKFDADLKHFVEVYGEDVYNAILKMIDGVHDEDVERIKEDYGDEDFNKLKKLIAGTLAGEELRLFIEKNREFYRDFKKLIKTRTFSSARIPGTPYKKGDFIDEDELYEIYDVLGMGGFGIVYLVYSYGHLFALKTFRDEYLKDVQTRERFKKEAQTWIELERHPYIVRARSVEILSGRPYIEADYIAPNKEGLNTLDGYLKHRPPDLAQSLRWGIQFCHGMEYAYSKGIRAHRDIKPANIMIGYDKFLKHDKVLKITDFGIAGVIEQAKISGTKLGFRNDTIGLSCQTMEGRSFGTPTHMPPEQFTNAAACDERSDIYSFGIVLYQMATGGNLPFLPKIPQSEQEHMRFWQDIYRLHCQTPVPKLNSPLFSIIQRCLEKSPGRRYQSFQELRADIEPLLKRLTGEVIGLPRYPSFRNSHLMEKGNSLEKLGKHHEAIACYDKMLEISPRDAAAWSCKGSCLAELGKYGEALACYDRMIEVSMKDSYWHSSAWNSKGELLLKIGKRQEATACYEKALEIRPNMGWHSKGDILYKLDRYQEAVACYDEGLEKIACEPGKWLITQQAQILFNKGTALFKLGNYQAAIEAFEQIALLDLPRDYSIVINTNSIINKLRKKLTKKSFWKRLFE